MSGVSLEQQVGQVQGRLDAVERQVKDVHADVKAIRTTLEADLQAVRTAVDRAYGGGRLLVGTWRFLVGLVAVGASLGSAVSYAATTLLGG